ncbi:transposase [Pedobacter psychrophilus]|uniref:Transposase n=1 Tax=Pedobacter psychrophilus TaxID=1826909 RepID=A0A179DB52_9SPHI|nr:transposase [Pedobacter psychrophilus]OAQ38257.1 transposase [Pedobacter psychrophilus]
MAFAYRIYDQKGIYFITCTVNQWVDVFTRKDYIDILLESLIYCQKHKGLKIFSWVVMTNHIHLIIGTNKDNLSDIIRDFKKYTSTKITLAITNNQKESRKNWMLWLLKKEDYILFWQEGYHGEEITSLDFFNTKQDYIHLNPVRAGLVEKEEEYLYSSCGQLYGIRNSMLELTSFV